MLRKIIWATQWFCVAIFLCWILAATYSLGTACPHPNQSAQHKPTEDKSDNPCSFRESLGGRFIAWVGHEVEHDPSPLVAIGTWALAIFTFGLFIFTAQLWRSTRTLVNDAKETAQRQLRAYVWVKATELENFGTGLRPQIICEVRNAGLTPAYELEITAGCLVYSYPLGPNTPFPTMKDRHASKMTLHPGSDLPFLIVAAFEATELNGLAGWQCDKLIEGKEIRLFAFVNVSYRDAFKNKRRTRMCISLDGSDSKPGSSSFRPIFAHEDQHNDAC